MKREILEQGERVYLLLGVVKGLKEEYDRVISALRDFSPDVVCMGISKEEVEGLRRYLEEPFEYDPSDYDVIYAKHLSAFGQVFLPPPAYVAAVRYAMDSDVDVEPLDMDNEKYSQAYVTAVTAWDLIRHTMRKRRLYRKKIRGTTPEEVIINLDREIRKIKGYDLLERTRERHMANRLAEVSGKKIAAVVEVERLEGVIATLRERYSATRPREAEMPVSAEENTADGGEGSPETPSTEKHDNSA